MVSNTPTHNVVRSRWDKHVMLLEQCILHRPSLSCHFTPHCNVPFFRRALSFPDQIPLYMWVPLLRAFYPSPHENLTHPMRFSAAERIEAGFVVKSDRPVFQSLLSYLLPVRFGASYLTPGSKSSSVEKFRQY